MCPDGRASRAVWKTRFRHWSNRALSKQWLLKEEHSHQTFGQWRRHRSDGQSDLPSTTRDHVSATKRWSRTAAAVGVSVDTAHCQNTTDWHLATAVVERAQLNDCHELLLAFLIETARVGPRSRRGVLSTIMEPLKIDPVPLGASQTQTHKPSRGCVASRLNLPLRLSA